MYVWFQSLFKCRRLPVSLDCPFLFKISMDLDEGQVRLILRTMKWKKKKKEKKRKKKKKKEALLN